MESKRVYLPEPQATDDILPHLELLRAAVIELREEIADLVSNMENDREHN